MALSSVPCHHRHPCLSLVLILHPVVPLGFVDHPEFKPRLGGRKSCPAEHGAAACGEICCAILEMEAGESVEPGELGLVWQKRP